MDRSPEQMDRRQFLKTTAAGVAAAGAAGPLSRVARAADEKPDKKGDASPPAADPRKLIHRNENPNFVYRRLGRTDFNCGRIVAGWVKEPALLRRYVAEGVNYLDTARGYGEYEVALGEQFRKKTIKRDDVWITSKATGIAGYNIIDPQVQDLYREAMGKFLGDKVTISVGDKTREVDPGKAKQEAFLGVHKECVKKMKATGESPDWRPLGKRISEMYARMLDESLGKDRLGVEYVDCYFVHGIEIPWIFKCIELWETYEKAHKAGKVKHFGFSTHNNQKDVLAAAAEANEKGPWKIDLIMPGVNPITFHEWRDELAKLKKQDVGIVAMKTSGKVRHATTKREEKLAEVFEGRKLNDWERAKTYMLHATDELIDACIAAVDKDDQIGRTLGLPKIQLAAAARRELEAVVRLEMAGACHLCGDCTTICPEDVAVADILRYHAYIHQYDDREQAVALYRTLGYDPSKRCTNCGACKDVCPESIDLMAAINEVVARIG